MYKLETEILETHEALLSIEVEEDASQTAMQQAARLISRNVRIPGFRKGRAPYSKVLRFVGAGHIKQEAADALLEELYPKVIEDAGIQPYDWGTVEEHTLDPLTFKLRVPLAPEVDLGDYQSIRQDWEEPEVNDEEVAEVLEQIREEHAIEETVNRPCQYGDVIYVDVFGTVDEDDVIFDKEDQSFLLDEDEPFITPAFYDELVGLEAGAEKTFTITLPEDMEDEELQNAEATFDVIVNRVCTHTLPEVDDALASTVGSFETLEELKVDIRERLLEFKAQQQEETYQEILLNALVEKAEVSYPPVMLEETLDDLAEEADQQMQREHKISLEDALTLDGKTMEEFRESMMQRARERLIRSLVLSKFAQEQEIQATDAEVLETYADLLESFGGIIEDAPELDVESELGQNLRRSTLGRKVFERLMALGKGEVAAETPEAEPAEENDEAGEEEEAPAEEA